MRKEPEQKPRHNKGKDWIHEQPQCLLWISSLLQIPLCPRLFFPATAIPYQRGLQNMGKEQGEWRSGDLKHKQDLQQQKAPQNWVTQGNPIGNPVMLQNSQLLCPIFIFLPHTWHFSGHSKWEKSKNLLLWEGGNPNTKEMPVTVPKFWNKLFQIRSFPGSQEQGVALICFCFWQTTIFVQHLDYKQCNKQRNMKIPP